MIIQHLFNELLQFELTKFDSSFSVDKISNEEFDDLYSFISFRSLSDPEGHNDALAYLFPVRKFDNGLEVICTDADVKKAILKFRKQKFDIFEKMSAHYNSLSGGKSVPRCLLPISIRLLKDVQDRHYTFEHGAGIPPGENFYLISTLKKSYEELNAALKHAVHELKHKSVFKRSLGYIRLSMIDEMLCPYIHIVFILNDKTVSFGYIQELIFLICNSINESSIAEFYSFDCNFQHVIYDEVIKDKENEEKILRLIKGDILTPFAKYDYKRAPFTSPKADELFRTREAMRKTKSKKKAEIKLKQYEKITDIQGCHLNYLLKVAKKYNAIPGVKGITLSKATYRRDK